MHDMPRRIILAAVLVVALAGCAIGDSSAGVGGGPTGSGGPAPVLGTFDRSALESTFDTTLTEQDLTATKRRYTADYRLPLGLEFTIDPADPTSLVETAVRFSIDRTPAERTVERSWIELMSRLQPDALRWIRRQRDDYLADPGRDLHVRSRFGPVCAGFFTYGAETSATGRADVMGYFVETQEAHVNCPPT